MVTGRPAMAASPTTLLSGLDGSTVAQAQKAFLIYRYADPEENRPQGHVCMLTCMGNRCTHRRHRRPLWFHDGVALTVRPAHTRKSPRRERAGAASSLAPCPATLRRRSGIPKAPSTGPLWPLKGCPGRPRWLRHDSVLSDQVATDGIPGSAPMLRGTCGSHHVLGYAGAGECLPW